MTDFLSRIKKRIPDKKKRTFTQNDLQKWGLKGIRLRCYQLDGVRWLTQSLQHQQGCILGDEMGLGKTCQTISLLLYISSALGKKGPFLVVSPLSVLENWRKELESFAPSSKVLRYQGDKDKRAEIQQIAKTNDFHVLLTTYEMCLRDSSFFMNWSWEALVVDEAHRLKNQNSLLHQTLTKFSTAFRLLLTGTPIQNNLQELFSLLSFIQPSVFLQDDSDSFCSRYGNVRKQPELATELQSVLEPFLLRRVKSEVALDLPKKTELVMYHGITTLQKKYYKAILMKDLEAFGSEGSKTRLLNILVQLRKCVIHPYLFDGVEPEPFVMGEHLVEASGKFCLLDSLLSYMYKGGHRVLLFSQMTRTLDVIQDYLEYRGYSYERLDGSVRGEERNLAVKNFSTNDIFVFLLSTKAGGVGMNLTAADTVIFMDTDFNPQNDLQAAARCHRIGQNRPVKIIRLIARDTVEEIMYSRAVSKLHLTNTVIEEGRFSLMEQAQSAAAGLQLSEILKFGVDKLLSSDESSVQEVKLENILGLSEDGRWLDDEEPTAVKGNDEEEEEEGGSETEGQNHMYYFEGRDYSKDPSSEDQRSFDRLMEEQLAELQRTAGEGRALRHKASVSLSLVLPTRKRRILTEEELEVRRQRRKEAAAKRAKTQEELRKRQQEEKYQKKMAWWESCGYRSRRLASVDSDDEEEEEEEDGDSVNSTDSEPNAINYVLGDVTHPHAAREDAVIVHCVDDSGRWGRGGLFTALEVRSDEPKKQYELAGKMKDLELGNVLLFPIDDKQSRMDGQDQLALIVAQQRDKANNLSGIFLSALEEGLKKIYTAAKRNKASVHLPRIGHSTKGFNWYGTERLIRKHLATRGVPTYIYYHSRSAKKPSAPPQTSAAVPSAAVPSASCPRPQRSDDLSDESEQTPCPSSGESEQTPGPSSGESEQTPGPSSASSAPPQSSHAALPSFMSGVHVHFYNLLASDRKRLARYLLTYDGDEEDIMSAEVTHIVAEIENQVHKQELKELVVQFPRAVAVRSDWLDSCFSKQRLQDTTPFLLLE